MTVWAALESLPFAEYLRHGRWSYALVNAAHILGIALLLGAVIPLNLRLTDLAWRGMPVAAVEQLLRPAAAAGLVLAIVTGFVLFSVNATEYAGARLFQVKMALILVGTFHALLHVRGLADATRRRRRLTGWLSAGFWLTVLVCGRFLGFL